MFLKREMWFLWVKLAKNWNFIVAEIYNVLENYNWMNRLINATTLKWILFDIEFKWLNESCLEDVDIEFRWSK